MHMTSHSLERSDLTIRQQLNLSGELWACSTRRQAVLKLRSGEYTQLAERQVTEPTHMSVRWNSPNVSHLELAMWTPTLMIMFISEAFLYMLS